MNQTFIFRRVFTDVQPKVHIQRRWITAIRPLTPGHGINRGATDDDLWMPDLIDDNLKHRMMHKWVQISTKIWRFNRKAETTWKEALFHYRVKLICLKHIEKANFKNKQTNMVFKIYSIRLVSSNFQNPNIRNYAYNGSSTFYNASVWFKWARGFRLPLVT